MNVERSLPDGPFNQKAKKGNAEATPERGHQAIISSQTDITETENDEAWDVMTTRWQRPQLFFKGG